MSIMRIKEENLARVAPLFNGWDETLIWSCLQGCMGSAYADDPENPGSAQIINADFCFFAGKPNAALVKHKPEDCHAEFVIMTPQNSKWAALIEEEYGARAKQVTRYAFYKEKDAFDKDTLQRLSQGTAPDYQIEMLTEDGYTQAMSNEWSRDLCSQFAGYAHYKEKGLGVGAFYRGELVAGASSYAFYRGGIEVEIDTRKDHRRRGLARACGARLILECLERGLYPSWDAQNPWSAALAQQLGYRLNQPYRAYEIADF